MTAPLPVLGVDPGGRYTGLVARRRTEVLVARVLDRRRLDRPDRRTWVDYVVTAVGEELDALGPAVLAVEDVVAPSPHVRRRDGNALTNVEGILDTAVVVGALLALWPAAELVRPGGNGAGPAALYPPTIAKGARLGGPSDHARAAYDVAGAAAFVAMVRP